MSLGGVAVTVLVLTGGLAVVPVAAMAQEAPAPATPAAVVSAPAQPAPGPADDTGVPDDKAAEAAGCPSEDEDSDESVKDLLAAAPDPEADASAARADDVEGPLAHCSQNAGEEQYKDPFANSGPPKAGGGSQPSGGGGTASPTAATAVAQQASAESGDPAAAGENAGPALPSTGLDAGPLVAAGLALLFGGAALRRRIA